MDMNELLLLALVFCGLIFWVGLYVFMMLNIMRLDPREKNFRKGLNLKNGIIPRKK